MKRLWARLGWKWRAAAAIGLALAAGTIWMVSRPAEPRVGGRPVSAWMVELRFSKDRVKRFAALDELMSWGDEALPVWRAMLKAHPTLAERAVLHLRGIGAPNWLVRASAILGRPSEYTPARLRMEAIQRITSGSLRWSAHILAPDLLALVSSNDLFESTGAADALAQVHPDAAEVVPPLLALLRHPTWHVRRSAFRALQAIAPSNPVLLQILVTELRHREAWVRLSAALHLAAQRHEPSLTADALADLLGSDLHEDPRTLAAHALGTLETLTPSAIAALQMATNDASEAVRSAARWALAGREATSDPVAPPQLIEPAAK